MSRSTAGKCFLCNGTFTKGAMTNHLKRCMAKEGAGLLSVEGPGPKEQVVRTFHLLVEGRYGPEYWMHVEVPAAAKLGRVDQFLRDVWVECCDHLSAFTIGDTRYNVSGSARDLGGRTMNVALYGVLRVGTRFSYEYDFGSTTKLALRVIAEGKGRLGARPIVRVLARNDPPQIACGTCGEPATQVCTSCMWEEEGWLCEKCASEHECGDEMLLPVANSPRVGVCGYSG